MSARKWRDRIAWAKANAHKPPSGLGSGSNSAHPHSWYRMCQQFVRVALGVGGGAANAGAAWDQARHKVRVGSCREIPAGYPVYWETSGVDDHVALKVGGLGSPLVRSTDAVTPGEADVVDGDKLTARWGMVLHGFTRDVNGTDVTRDDDPLLAKAHNPPARPSSPPRAVKSRGARVDRALRELRGSSKGTGARRAGISAAIKALKRVPFTS